MNRTTFHTKAQDRAREYTGAHAVSSGQLARARRSGLKALRTSQKRLLESGHMDRMNRLPETAANRLENGRKAVDSGQFAEVAPRGRRLGRHVRWHVNRGIKRLGCEFCEAE